MLFVFLIKWIKEAGLTLSLDLLFSASCGTHANIGTEVTPHCTEVTPCLSAWQLAFLNHPLNEGRQWGRGRGRAKFTRRARISKKITKMKWKYHDGRTVLLSVSALITTLSGKMSVWIFFFFYCCCYLVPWRSCTAQRWKSVIVCFE